MHSVRSGRAPRYLSGIVQLEQHARAETTSYITPRLRRTFFLRFGDLELSSCRLTVKLLIEAPGFY